MSSISIVCDKRAAHKSGQDVLVQRFDLIPLPTGGHVWYPRNKKPGAGRSTRVEALTGARYKLECRPCKAEVTVRGSTLNEILWAWHEGAPKNNPLDISTLSGILGANPFRP